VTHFKPAGVPLSVLGEITLTLDELEALRLADLNGMYQEKAAQRMNISARPSRVSWRRHGGKWQMFGSWQGVAGRRWSGHAGTIKAACNDK